MMQLLNQHTKVANHRVVDCGILIQVFYGHLVEPQTARELWIVA
jgi:hypothetical protein